MKNSRFQKGFRGSGCYTCRICGKKTRETGDEESDAQLCRKCNREAFRENFHFDMNHKHDFNDIENCPECIEAGYTIEYINN